MFVGEDLFVACTQIAAPCYERTHTCIGLTLTKGSDHERDERAFADPAIRRTILDNAYQDN